MIGGVFFLAGMVLAVVGTHWAHVLDWVAVACLVLTIPGMLVSDWLYERTIIPSRPDLRAVYPPSGRGGDHMDETGWG